MIRITIVGMGLIGTSLGMALRSANEKEAPLGQIYVTGYDKSNRATSDARGRLAIDREAHSLGEALREAQLVVIAVPVQMVREVFMAIAPVLPTGAVVTDVASVKGQVMEWARELQPTTVEFVGGHPMAGRERSGAGAASPDLFKSAVYCLTPSPRARQAAIDLVDAMVQQIGAKTYFIDPDEHDAYVAGVSHLPFLLSTALVDLTSSSAGWKEMAPLAATGFRDITRLASGDPEMHRDICMTNRAAISRWLDEAARTLLDVREQIDAGRGDDLLEFFERAREARERWLHQRPNLRPGESEFEDISGGPIERPGLFGWFGRAPRNKGRSR
ncbi:MAG TPA: prephenate dehydrogenase/arogenate dehydrogenase family protein [Roseiflexaceae bacterium]|nr:prephenate dehydrogenase/arogenate dehydrogenase family protein [Roseiflexaceae bacterium]